MDPPQVKGNFSSKYCLEFDIPLFDLGYTNALLKDDILDIMERHIETSTFIFGPDVQRFEEKFAGLIGCKYAVGVGSGTDALILGLKALAVKPGDEVITVPNSYIATAQAIAHVGATPVFVDVDENTMNLDLNLVQTAITQKTKAIIPVHLYGFPVDIYQLRAIVGGDIYILEDCAQSHGALVGDNLTGSMGNVGCFSLHPAKILSSLGDAGVITTNNESVFNQCILLRNFGLENRDSSIVMGYNSRLDNIYAAIMYRKIDLFGQMLEKRLENASVYYDELADFDPVTLPPQKIRYKNVHNFFVIRVSERDALKKYLEQNGIETKVHYPIPIHLQKSFQEFGYESGSFPEAEKQSKTILTIPVAEHLNTDQVKNISQTIKDFFEKRSN